MGCSDAGQSRVCCKPETPLSSLQAAGRSCAGGKSSAVTKVVGHVQAWCEKTHCWFYYPGGQSPLRRDGWSCTVGTTNTAREKVSQSGIRDFINSLQHVVF